MATDALKTEDPVSERAVSVKRIADILDNYLAIEWKIRSRNEHELVAEALEVVASRLRKAAEKIQP
ncbi:hypothetical protein NIES2135_53750 [Leptolyngbya boryana NIES-2135]|jgi:hypothetical protein|uniref:Uncharacterized protein n=1 Tax=Leptolyngbya boryana NIES-2135 TaxID=1973484 RepID=A0A1Z4JP18_LEPBY|nr:hypothetical protein LBWT_12460 [Leptolyngbya boryana IAM M-101]BAS61688.1 hypothetical protein LBDG_12460 [Leptolyngbya boryana dg5]BAY58502.1 hypothetical protein NIES2135_53750 [Leptolyngbya boryana NIES-2135]